jgi:tripartite-type tricarboxylate transporter receptor subunit TctC
MKLIVLLTYVLGISVELASAQVPFYQDKTITVILGGPPAGSADLRTRAVNSLLRKHIPGNPTITVSYTH